jgi:UDPglucose 6-dehydrogenase
MNKKQLLVLVSTVLPGTTRKHFAPLVTKTNFVYNPYLIAMGTVKEDFLNPEMIMIGTEKGGKSRQALILTEFYKNVLGHEPRTEYCTWDECEAIKIFYNTFISTKIALVNMIQDVAVKNGNINVDNVTNALSASTNRIISQKYMTAGMGDGGSCHPRDNIALRWLSKRLNLNYDIFSAIIEAREMQAKNMATEILKHGKVIHFTSDSYKPGTTMTDGSYSLLVQHYIRELGGVVSYGFDQPIDVHVLTHPGDSVELSDGKGIIFDPWRKYPKGSNVIHYGDNDNV